MELNKPNNPPPGELLSYSAYCDRFRAVVIRCLLGGRASVSDDEKAEVVGWFRTMLDRQAFPHSFVRRGTLDLRRLRRQAGLTQRDFAALVGVGERTVRRWEKTGTVPRVEAARAIAACFSLDPRDVVQQAGARLDGGTKRPRDYVAAQGDFTKPLVGANLRALREGARLTQAQMAAACGVSRMIYSRYEVGALFPAMPHTEWRRRVTAALETRDGSTQKD